MFYRENFINLFIACSLRQKKLKYCFNHKPMRINFIFKLLFALSLLYFFSGCVSKKEYNKLLQTVEDLKKNPANLNMEDKDNDGVLDFLDQQIDSPEGCAVDTRGVTIDSDGDGLIDCMDVEPYSPQGYQVDDKGIAKVPKTKILTEKDVKKIIKENPGPMPISTGTGANPIDELTYPEFNIPAPHFSKMTSYPIREKITSTNTLGEVDAEFKAILKKSGFYDDSNQPLFSYYQVKKDGKFQGYALVTAFEKIDKSGKPLSDRFNLTVNKKASKSFLDYIFPSALNKGYFRCFAFLVTDEYFGTRGERMSRDEMAKALQDKALKLHPLMAEQPVSERCEFHVLVYEFEQLESEKDGAPATLGQLPVQTHLEGAGIWKYLKSN